jgi:hypothetical protein
LPAPRGTWVTRSTYSDAGGAQTALGFFKRFLLWRQGSLRRGCPGGRRSPAVALATPPRRARYAVIFARRVIRTRAAHQRRTSARASSIADLYRLLRVGNV